MAKPFLHCHRRFKNGKDHCYWSIAEKVRTARGWVQRPLLYLGEINDSQKAAWTKVTDVFDTRGQQTRPLALYPADRAVPDHAHEFGVQVLLSEFVLRRPRQWGACWIGCKLWDQLKMDEFWRERLADSREGTCWRQVLQTLTVYRLIDPGSEWRLHRQWFENSAMADLLDADFGLVHGMQPQDLSVGIFVPVFECLGYTLQQLFHFFAVLDSGSADARNGGNKINAVIRDRYLVLIFAPGQDAILLIGDVPFDSHLLKWMLWFCKNCVGASRRILTAGESAGGPAHSRTLSRSIRCMANNHATWNTQHILIYSVAKWGHVWQRERTHVETRG